jgi:hypothetical protein
MKPKSYNFEHTNGAADHVELHRKGHKFHILARLMCLILAVVFWLLVNAWQNNAASADAADSQDTAQTQVQTE